MTGPSVLVVDDQTLFRTGLVHLLASDPRVEVAGAAADGAEAVDFCGRQAPDVVLMDLKMPRMDGLEATRTILDAAPTTRVLMLTAFESDANLLSALSAGASGYVMKDAEPEAVVSSILAVCQGEKVMSATVARRVVELALPATPSRSGHDGLSVRELEILRLIAEGSRNPQIASLLNISDKTVRNHVSRLYSKLAISDRSQAVLYAARHGLVQL
jgi:DNA-binding NarL/FixJ family response regulator